MKLQQLATYCPPPTNPVFRGSITEWSDVEARLGLVFPQDYKECLGSYGGGAFDGYVSQINPFLSVGGYSYFAQIRDILTAYRDLHSLDAIQWPYQSHPEPGGLFPSAISDNGDTLYWITEGVPDSWSLILYNSRHWRCEHYKMTFTSWLCDWLTGKLTSDILPRPQSTLFVQYELSGE